MSMHAPKDPTPTDGTTRWWGGLLAFISGFAVIYGISYLVLGQTWPIAPAPPPPPQSSPSSYTHTPTEPVGNIKDMLKDPNAIQNGGLLFKQYCIVCHGAEGQGGSAPNLTDPYWIHGGSPESVASTIESGVPTKGMAAWGPILGMQKVNELAAFVMSLQGTHPSNPKAPEGQKEGNP